METVNVKATKVNKMAIHSEYFLHSGFIFEVRAEINERTEMPKFNQSLFVDDELAGTASGRFTDAVNWLKDNFYRYI